MVLDSILQNIVHGMPQLQKVLLKKAYTYIPASKQGLNTQNKVTAVSRLSKDGLFSIYQQIKFRLTIQGNPWILYFSR